MTEGVSCVQNDLSRIDINRSPVRKKKVYPKSLIPDGQQQHSSPKHSGSRIPSTSSSRLLSSSGNGINPRTPSRNISSTAKSMSTIKHASDKRIISYPMSEKPISKQQYQFSFMKETTSSLQKKQSNPFQASKYSSPMASKKRVDPQRTRRFLSATLSHATQLQPPAIPSSHTIPVDITNIGVSPNKSFSKDFNNDFSPIRQRYTTRRNVSQPVTSFSSQPYLPASEASSSSSASNSNSNSSNVFTRLYPRSTLSDNNRQVPPQSDNIIPKINSIPEMYKILFESNVELFDPLQVDNSHEGSTSIPILPDDTLLNKLNVYERGEIIRKPEVFYVPTTINRKINITSYRSNFGFDDKNGNYIIIPNDHINYRYEVISLLGNGSFGNVVKAKDHKFNKIVAVKIIKNDLNWSLQSINEIKMLKLLKEKNTNENLLEYYDHFNFRSHMCIVTELLTINLYTLLELINFRGLSIPIIQKMSCQLLQGLQYLHSFNIIHCDIKPENIMINLPSDPQSNDINVKIIDFGSSCYKNEISFTYIQSRFYRAPEIIMGANYSEKIDIWSLGCVVVELFLGFPLLPGKNELEQIGLILEYFGAPKSTTILRLRRALNKSSGYSNINSNNLQLTSINEKQIKKTLLFKIFDVNGKINMSLLNFHLNNSGMSSFNSSNIKKQYKLSSKSLDISLNLNKYSENQTLTKSFTKFLNKIFIWDPVERASVSDLLNEGFLQDI
ncbi:serine-threonine protein kinase [Scheffersomyces amazonensis]|uniref:serine-threonine protein kinase n=1 Tax=Scheffersomyces amazonensis TaxID=1078765 RepID=UPI00315CCA15